MNVPALYPVRGNQNRELAQQWLEKLNDQWELQRFLQDCHEVRVCSVVLLYRNSLITKAANSSTAPSLFFLFLVRPLVAVQSDLIFQTPSLLCSHFNWFSFSHRSGRDHRWLAAPLNRLVSSLLPYYIYDFLSFFFLFAPVSDVFFSPTFLNSIPTLSIPVTPSEN